MQSSHHSLWWSLASGSLEHFLSSLLSIPGSLVALASAARLISNAAVSISSPILWRAAIAATSLLRRAVSLPLLPLPSYEASSSPSITALFSALAIRSAKEWSWSGTPSVLQFAQRRSPLALMRSISSLNALCSGPSDLTFSLCLARFWVFNLLLSMVFFVDLLATISIDGRQVGLTCSILRLAMCPCKGLRWASQAVSNSTSFSEIPRTFGHANLRLVLDLPRLGMESKVPNPADASFPRILR